MRSWMSVGLMAVLALSNVYGCDEGDEEPVEPVEDAGPGPEPEPSRPEDDAGVPMHRHDGRSPDSRDAEVADASSRDAGSEQRDGGLTSREPDAGSDASSPSRPDASQGESPAPTPSESPRTQVPDELVGTWHTGSFDFVLWENYRQGYWAGRDAIPTREAMIFSPNGDAKFYRYEGLFNFYEELIDCEGSVAFHDDGTFTFYPSKGRKRFYDARYSPNNVDRALTPNELLDADIAGTRAYAYDASDPSKLRIKVPSSATYNWYRAE